MKFQLATLAWTSAMLIAVPLSVRADTFDDCRQARPAEKRLAACSEVISGNAFSQQQKAVAYRQRGNARLDAGALERAESDLTESIRLDATEPSTRLLRAQVRVSRNDIANALSDFDEAIRLDPRSSNAFTGRGHAHLVKGNAELAIADFTTVLTLLPDSASAYNNRGLAYRRAGNADRAIADFSAAIARNPIYALAYNNRGYAYESRGERDAAIRDFSQALLLDPALTGARQGLERLNSVGSLTRESSRLIAEGKALVEEHCSRCHAVAAQGASANSKAPPFRVLHSRHPAMALREPLTRGIAAPHDEMPKFEIPTPQIDKIVAYINSLAPRR